MGDAVSKGLRNIISAAIVTGGAYISYKLFGKIFDKCYRGFE